MNNTTLLTVMRQQNGMFCVAYDGNFLGDDRSFETAELCEQEIDKRLKKDAREAVIYARPLLYTKG